MWRAKEFDIRNKCSYNIPVNIQIRPDAQQKIALLSPLSQLECDGEPALTPRQQQKRDFLAGAVVQVQRPDGPLTVLRTMQTSACEKNCRYCPFRAGRGRTPRVTFQPDELAREFDRMQQAGVVNGLFLSSGIVGGGSRAMDPMLATAEILRRKYHYRGYIHLKVMPGAEYAQVEAAMRLADRLSINLEGANTERLAFLAPQKEMRGQLVQAMQWFRRLAGQCPPTVKIPSLTTQFVVGPAGESDRELLTGVEWLYRRLHLSRAYYSPFRPIPGTPLEGSPATPLHREHRLYQADWLLRFYGFTASELPFDAEGMLPAGADPKLVWAQRHLSGQPVEINRASRAALLRVPGIGPRTADAILQARRESLLRDISRLRKLGAAVNRAAPFILLDGRRPPRQLSLF
ncbi:MAG: radical SAM protein [Caldilineae bacterium]|nr:MAG: radical SAM protein [Caldilineae bacterium]